MDFTILFFAIHIVWRANVICTYRKSGIARKTTVAYPELRLIARAVYKNPDYIFLDEATNSLDSNNERSIVENLDKFYKGKTVVIVAHRLSTVKNADQIVVIDHGKVVEVGNHESLTAKRGAYYNLVKNQLELGN